MDRYREQKALVGWFAARNQIANLLSNFDNAKVMKMKGNAAKLEKCWKQLELYLCKTKNNMKVINTDFPIG